MFPEVGDFKETVKENMLRRCREKPEGRYV